MMFEISTLKEKKISELQKIADELSIEKITGLKQSLNTHRNGLFMQSLLWHQTLTASKYMSQWIEAKNK